MGIELAKVFVSIRGRDDQLTKDLNSSKSKLTSSAARLGAAVGGAFAAAFTLRAALGFARESIGLAERQIQAEQRLRATLRATGGAAGFSAEQLISYAGALQKASTIGDEAILESMALLTTFKNVNGQVFKRAQEAAIDLSEAGYGELRSTTIQLAKALEDPTLGMTMLRRSGVMFSKQVQEQIKDLVEQNRLFEAQQMLLEGVEGQVSKTAAALAQTPAGRLKQINNELGDMKEEIGKGLLPLLVRIKEKQLELMQPIKEWILTIMGLVDQWKISWEIMKTNTLLKLSIVGDAFTGVQTAIANVTSATVFAVIEAWKGFFDWFRESLQALWVFFKETNSNIALTASTVLGALAKGDIGAATAFLKAGGSQASSSVQKARGAMVASTQTFVDPIRKAFQDELKLMGGIGAGFGDSARTSQLRSRLEELQNRVMDNLTIEGKAPVGGLGGNIADELEKRVAEPIVASIPDLGNQIQQALLEDTDFASKQVDLQAAGNQIQADILEAQKEQLSILRAGELGGGLVSET